MKRRSKYKIPRETQATIYKMYGEGAKYKEIARAVNLHANVVQAVIGPALRSGALKRRRLKGAIRRMAGLPSHTQPTVREHAMNILRAEVQTMSRLGAAALQTLITDL